MAVKSVSIRIEEEMLRKIGYVADYEGRSVNSHILLFLFVKTSSNLRNRTEKSRAALTRISM